MKASGIGLVVLGMLLILGAILWHFWTPTAGRWTNEQADDYSEAAARYHNLSFQYANSSDQRALDKVAAAEEQFEQQRDQLDRALSAKTLGVAILKWSGITCAIIGAGLLLAHRQSEQQS